MVCCLRNIAGPLLAIAGAWAQSTAPNAPAAPARPKLAEEEFQEYSSSQGNPGDQVIPSMQFIAASLGSNANTATSRMRRKGRQKAQSHRAKDDQHDDGDQ